MSALQKHTDADAGDAVAFATPATHSNMNDETETTDATWRYRRLWLLGALVLMTTLGIVIARQQSAAQWQNRAATAAIRTEEQTAWRAALDERMQVQLRQLSVGVPSTAVMPSMR